jgi:hypothetical protein
MRLIFLVFLACITTLAGRPPRIAEPEPKSDLRSRPKAPRSKGTFLLLRLFRRLGNAESELALRLSSWGIERKIEAAESETVPPPSPLTETSIPMAQGPIVSASQ